MTTVTMRETIAARIAELNPQLEDKVVDHFVGKELEKRAEAIVLGTDNLTKLERELPKVSKADMVSFNSDGTVANETYSKARLDEVDKLKKRIAKLMAAIDKAYVGDCGDLYGLNNNKGGDAPKGDE